MAQFDQRGQHVTNQINADTVTDFNQHSTPTHNQNEFTGLLESIKQQLLSSEISVNLETEIDKAIQESAEPEPNKQAILKHLTKAKTLLEGVTKGSGVITSIGKAIQVVRDVL